MPDEPDDVFISYRHVDKEVIGSLVRVMIEAGLRFFVDERNVDSWSILDG